MDRRVALALVNRMLAEKRGDADLDAFANTAHGMANAQLRSDAGKDVRNIGLASLGVGIGARGLVGLLNLMRQKPKKMRSGPALLPLPYPAEEKLASFMGGTSATSKGGIPWYRPAMFFTGLAGLGLGWKGIDAVLDKRRRRDIEERTDAARKDFHDALLSSYEHPVMMRPGLGKTASDSLMSKVGAALDKVFASFTNALTAAASRPGTLKTALDLGNVGGNVLGGYGVYAGLSGLLAGALLYDKTRKRSQASIVQKALQRRQRRQFAQQPTEIYATPEPVTA